MAACNSPMLSPTDVKILQVFYCGSLMGLYSSRNGSVSKATHSLPLVAKHFTDAQFVILS